MDTQNKSLIAMERDEAHRAAFRTRIVQRAAHEFVIVDANRE